MKTIAIINCGGLALAIRLASAAVPALGQGTLIIQHSGATDPVTEGFQNLGHGSGYPVINDMGVNAWVTPGITNGNPFYEYWLTPQQEAESVGADWILSVNLRIATTNSGPWFGLAFYAAGIGLDFGSDSNGNQFVGYGYGLGTNYSVTLSGLNYHDYQLKYDDSADTVSLWIDGAEYANNILPSGRPAYLTEIEWGAARF